MSKVATISLVHAAKLQARPSLRSSSGQYWSLERFKSEWAAHRLSTKPADRAAAEEGVTIAYEDAGLAPPRIIWCDGPVSWQSDGCRRRLMMVVMPESSSLSSASSGTAIGSIGSSRPHQSPAPCILAHDARRMRSAPPCMQRSSRQRALSALSFRRWMRGLKVTEPACPRRLRPIDICRRSSSRPTRIVPVTPYEYLDDVLRRQRTPPLRGLFLVPRTLVDSSPTHVLLADRPNVLRRDVQGPLHYASGPALVTRWLGVVRV